LHETEFAQGFSLRLLDFAVQLQQFLDDREIIDSELANRDFQDSMGPLRIRFHKSAGHLFIYSSFSPGWRLRLAAGNFASGSYTFVSRFTAEVAQRAPLLLTWTSMSGLAKLA